MAIKVQPHISSPQDSYLRDWVYGGIDGTVTTFAVVSGVVGGHLSVLVILILGFANLLADGFSMAASNYLGTKSELEELEQFKKAEDKAIKQKPALLKNQIREMYQLKGLSGDTLDLVVDALTANTTLLRDTMLHDVYGISTISKSPLKAAFFTFISFLIFGFIPLVPYVLSFSSAFFWACVLTGVVFFVIGSIKSYWSTHSWIYSGFETLFIGTVAASLAYIIGYLLHLYLMVE